MERFLDWIKKSPIILPVILVGCSLTRPFNDATLFEHFC
jgi:hypothetical protein